jgi:hypothetical protein
VVQLDFQSNIPSENYTDLQYRMVICSDGLYFLSYFFVLFEIARKYIKNVNYICIAIIYVLGSGIDFALI